MIGSYESSCYFLEASSRKICLKGPCMTSSPFQRARVEVTAGSDEEILKMKGNCSGPMSAIANVKVVHYSESFGVTGHI